MDRGSNSGTLGGLAVCLPRRAPEWPLRPLTRLAKTILREWYAYSSPLTWQCDSAELSSRARGAHKGKRKERTVNPSPHHPQEIKVAIGLRGGCESTGKPGTRLNDLGVGRRRSCDHRQWNQMADRPPSDSNHPASNPWKNLAKEFTIWASMILS